MNHHSHSSRSVWLTPLLTLICLAATGGAAEKSGITVMGVGKVDAKPSIVELTGTINGEAELAGDAVTKFRGNRQSAIEAIEALEIAGLTIEGTGVSVNSAMSQQQMQAIMQGMSAQGDSAGKLAVSEPLKLTLVGVEDMDTEQLLETLVKIVDAGKDSGIVIGSMPTNINYNYGRGNTSTPLAKFKLTNIDELKAQAYEKAIADARKQAERLAEISEVKLGPITGIREGNLPGQNSQQVVYYNPYMQQQDDSDQYTSTDLRDITVTISLQVDFSIVEE